MGSVIFLTRCSPSDSNRQRELVFHVVDDGPRNGNAARLGELLQPRRDIDAIAVPILALDNHVTEIDTDAHVDAAIVCDILVALGHARWTATAHSTASTTLPNSAKQTVTHQLEDAALVFVDLRLEHSLRCATQAFEGPASSCSMSRL